MFTFDDLSAVSLAELIATNNWQSQYRLITQWGKLIQPKPALRIAEHLIKGCEVSAWLAHSCQADLHTFAFDSDSRVINGLAVLLLSQLQNKTRAEIQTVNFSELLVQVGLEKHLTPSRNNGLRAIIARAHECVFAK
jgi:cysteine desulfuration protein SufE